MTDRDKRDREPETDFHAGRSLVRMLVGGLVLIVVGIVVVLWLA